MQNRADINGIPLNRQNVLPGNKKNEDLDVVREKMEIAKRRKTRMMIAAQRVFALKCMLVFFIVSFSVAFILYKHVELNETNASVTGVKKQINKLDDSITKKKVEIESKITIKQLEEYIVNELDMVKIDSMMIKNIKLTEEDKIEVISQPDISIIAAFFGSIKNRFGKMVE